MKNIIGNIDVAILVPAFNEEKQINETLRDLENLFENIVVVDDGSWDNTYQEAKKSSAKVIRHVINLGQGAALQTAIDAALKNLSIRYLLTFDADGQHTVKSAAKLIEVIRATGSDVVLGTRFDPKLNSKIPLVKLIVLKIGIIFTRLDTGLKVTDTHNGLRVMTRQFAESLKIRQNGMAHASEILTHIKKTKANWQEVPVEVLYTSYSKKKGQSILNSVNIITEMIHR